MYFSDIVQTIGGEQARQIANAHTIFNIGTAVIFLPITGLMAKLIIKIMPDKPEDEIAFKTVYLNKNVLSNPIPAIDLLTSEIARAIKILSRMMEAIIIPFVEKDIPKDKYNPDMDLMEALEKREQSPH